MFFPCGCFFRDGIRNRNGLRSIFQFWNRKLNFKTQSYFFVSFFQFFRHFFVTFRVKKRISFSRSRWTKLKTTDLDKSMRTDLGKKIFDCRSSKWLKHFAQKCKFGTNVFSTPDFGPQIWTIFLIFLRACPFGARPFGARWAGPPLLCVERKYWKSSKEKVSRKTTLYVLTKITFLVILLIKTF